MKREKNNRLNRVNILRGLMPLLMLSWLLAPISLPVNAADYTDEDARKQEMALLNEGAADGVDSGNLLNAENAEINNNFNDKLLATEKYIEIATRALQAKDYNSAKENAENAKRCLANARNVNANLGSKPEDKEAVALYQANLNKIAATDVIVNNVLSDAELNRESIRKDQLDSVAQGKLAEANSMLIKADEILRRSTRDSDAGIAENAQQNYDILNKYLDEAYALVYDMGNSSTRAKEAIAKCEEYRFNSTIGRVKAYRIIVTKDPSQLDEIRITAEDLLNGLREKKYYVPGETRTQTADRIAKINQMTMNLNTATRDAEVRAATIPEILMPDMEERDQEIRTKLEQGRIFMRNKRYAEARDCFEEVLVRDPYNLTAIRNMTRINEELERAANERLHQVLKERIAEVRWKWSDPVTPLMSSSAEDTGTSTIRRTDDATGINKKLDKIVIPKIVFDNDPLLEVLSEILPRRIREADPEGIGINIVPLLTPLTNSAAVREEMRGTFNGGGGMGDMDQDYGADDAYSMTEVEEAAPAPTYEVLDNKPVSMSLSNVTPRDILTYISMGFGLNVKVRESAVVVAHPTVLKDEMETRFYNIAAGVFDTMRTRKKMSKMTLSDDDDSSDDDDDDDDDDDSSDSSSQTEAFMDVTAYLSKMGIPFPAGGSSGGSSGNGENNAITGGSDTSGRYVGATASYVSRSGVLIVHHTPEIHERISKVLDVINETPSLVTIEAKFVEIEQTNYEALGFEWAMVGGQQKLTDWDGSNYNIIGDDDVNGKSGGKSSYNNGNFQLGVADTDLSGSLRWLSDFTGDVALSGVDEVFSFYTVIGDYAFSTIIHALERESHSDVLSCPKVTTVSGKTAQLKMVTTRYFPEDWNEPELDVDNTGDSGSVTSSKPATPVFEKKELGVVLDVTPVVSAGSYGQPYSVELDLDPTVTDFIGYDDSWSYTMYVSGQPLEQTMNMPIYSEREVNTKVIVYDNETIVLGGMIKEDLRYYEDKIPFLGDIPIVGRLFRSKGEKSVKTNLMIFVNVRLVKPDGMPKRANELRGLPDFKH